MSKIERFITEFGGDARGATAIEYGLILALLSVVVATAVATLGTSLTGLFQKVVDLLV